MSAFPFPFGFPGGPAALPGIHPQHQQQIHLQQQQAAQAQAQAQAQQQQQQQSQQHQHHHQHHQQHQQHQHQQAPQQQQSAQSAQHPLQAQIHPQQVAVPGNPQIDPLVLQSLYPQAFQALALQQQLAAMAAGGKVPIPPQMQIYQAALAASFPQGGDSAAILQHFQQNQFMLQQMQQQQQSQQHQREKGADMYDDDYNEEEDDEDYEDDDGPRRRRKAKKLAAAAAGNKVPLKGQPRNYVVCKQCPSCRLSVGNNTRICRQCGHTFTNVKEHQPRSMRHLDYTPTNLDGSPLEARKSTRKRVKHNPLNSFDYIDKDEAAHVAIAIQNSMVKVKTGDLSQVKEAPEYRPNLEEWKDPMAYIEKIRPEAEQYGIAKIIPPAGWNPPCALKEDFKFSTRLQQIHRLTEAAGFEPGRQFTPKEYEQFGGEFKEKWIKERNEKTGSSGIPSDEEFEQAYWKIVETANPPTDVMYGNDISNVVSGGHAAFEPAGHQLDPSRYAGSPNWNLNLLPHAPGSVLKSLPNSIQGITEPWLYLGMLFATFCWHSEDDYLYSMNYLHKGANKIWYAIPARKAQQFEKVLQRTLAQLIYEEPDLHLKLVTMLPPSLLHSNQVPVFRTVQEPGTFIVTLPKAQHAGFSLGFNIAEAVNFATDDWFKYGREAMGRYRKYLRGSVLSYSQLLFDCILNQRWKYNIDTLRDELLHLYETELRGRRLCRDYGVTKKFRIDAENFHPGQELECAKCRIPLYLSFVCCPCVTNHAHLISPPRHLVVPEPKVVDSGDHQQQHDQQHSHEHDHSLHVHDDQMFNPNEHEPHHQQPPPQQPPQEEPAQPSEPAEPAEPEYTSECMCSCQHQIWCLDHVRFARWGLGTDNGGNAPVMYYRHVLPELVAMDEILALPPSADELSGKVSAEQILKERTAAIELDKDELPPTPPPPAAAAEFTPVETAAPAPAPAPVVAPKVKREPKRRPKRDSEDDEEFEPNPKEEVDDDDSDDDEVVATVPSHRSHYQPIQHPSMMANPMFAMNPMMMNPHVQMAMASLSAQQTPPVPQPRHQPRRSKTATGRADLKDGSYVNLDLVELDPVGIPELDADDELLGADGDVEMVEEEEDVTTAGTTNRRGRGLINPQVRQALSAIVEAIAEVSSMKVDDDGVQHMDMAPIHDMAQHAQHLVQMVPQQLGLNSVQMQQMQVIHQQMTQQMAINQQLAQQQQQQQAQQHAAMQQQHHQQQQHMHHMQRHQ